MRPARRAPLAGLTSLAARRAPLAARRAPLAALTSLAALAALGLLAAPAASAHPARDLEHPDRAPPEPRPCKCLRRDPPLLYEALTPGAFTERVVARAHVYNRGIRACLAGAGIPSAALSLSFARGATSPRVTSTGPRALATCLSAITWHSFDAPARATTVRVRVTDGPR